MLINAGLLTLLFATAMNTDDDDLFAKANQRHAPEQEQRMVAQAGRTQQQPRRAGGDEVDRAIQQHRQQETPAPAPLAEQRDPVPDGYVEVTVKQGETLEKIAVANGTTVRVIMQENNLRTASLTVGQKLRVPLPETTAANRPPPPQQEAERIAEYYTVQSGDNPWVISKRTGINFEEILRLNSLTEDKARRLQPGDRLRIR